MFLSPATDATMAMADSAGLSPRQSTTHSRRHSRRSTGNINLSQMSLSPLTSGPITEQDFRRTGSKRSSSYIQGLSAPTTPGILSRNHSFSSRRGSYMDLPKSKSSSHLVAHAAGGSSEWLQRTGAALTSETREIKGQSWLVSRASSTSLVKDGEDYLAGSMYSEGGDGDQLIAAFTTGGRSSRGYHDGGGGEFASQDLETLGRDLMAGVREEDEDANIPRGFGLGQFVDRIIGWSVFADDDTDDDVSLDGYEEEYALPKKAKFMNERVKFDPLEEEKLKEQRRLRDEDVGWQDPRVLLCLWCLCSGSAGGALVINSLLEMEL